MPNRRPHWLTPRLLSGTIAVLAGRLDAGALRRIRAVRDAGRVADFVSRSAASTRSSSLLAASGLRDRERPVGTAAGCGASRRARASVVLRLLERAFERMEARVSPLLIVLLIAVVSVVTSLRFNATTAGGSDAFSYVTQADLWLRGAPQMRIDMPIASAAPWPDAIGTFTPFGYRATLDRRAIVPVTRRACR